MSKKIGRNEKCPCGSEKKFKRCCGNLSSKNKSIKDHLMQYNCESVLQILAALSLQKENQSRFYRLALMAFDCCKYNVRDGAKASISNVIDILNNHYGETNPIWTYEDPHEVLFTDSLTFVGIGTMPVYTNLQENLIGSLRVLTETLYNGEDEILQELQLDTLDIVTTLLAMSWEISKHNMHGLYELGLNRVREPMSIESDNAMDVAINSPIILHYSDIETSYKALFEEGFVLTNDSFDITITEYDTDLPFFSKPFLKVDNGYMLIFPCTLIESIQNFILNRIIRYQQVDYTTIKYLNILKRRVHDQLENMGWARFTIEDVEDLHEDSHYMLYQVDSNIVCQVYCLTLDSETIKKGISPPYIFMPRVEDLTSKEITKRVQKDDEFSIFTLVIVDVLGQPFELYPMLESGHEIYFTKLEELEYLALDMGQDHLHLIKYLRSESSEKLNFMGGSRMDRYALYKEKRGSFYFGDDKPVSFITLEFGYGMELKKVIKTKHAKKFMLYDDKKLIEVVNRYTNANVSIYQNVNKHFNFSFLVQGFHPPIWIVWDPEQHSNDIYEISKILVDSLAFWTWRISKALFRTFQAPHKGFIKIKLVIDYHENEWNTKYDKCEILNEDMYSLYVEGDIITIELLEPFRKTLQSNKNYNDRILLNAVIEGLIHSSLLKLSDTEKSNFINQIAPIGYKTMTNKPYLVEEFIRNDVRIEFRALKSDDVETVLDQTIKICNISSEPREIKELKEKQKLCNDIVAGLFKEMKRILAKYNTLDLLEYFVNNYEATQREIQLLKGRMHSYLLCFDDVVNVKEELVESQRELDMTRLLNRSILEIIAAIQPSGKGKCSIMQMDYIVALMSSIMRYANLSDEYSCNLHENGMGILPSGRIGTNKDFGEEVHNKYTMDSFINQTNEVINENLGVSDRHVNNIIDSNQMRQAFTKEFGFTYEELKLVVNHIWRMVLEIDKCYRVLELDEILKRIDDIDKAKIKLIVSELSYIKRDPWQKNPDKSKYNSFDIYPWRYNRRYSLYSKPLIILENGRIVVMQRHLMLSLSYLNVSIAEGSFRGRSDQMIRAMSKVADLKGKSFCNHLFNTVSKHLHGTIIAKKEFKFSVLRRIYNNIDLLNKLGDIDILIIEPKNKLIFSIECKNTIQAKTSYQLYQQVLKIESGKWIEHHEDRHKWLSKNIEVLSEYFQLDLALFKVESFFVTPTVLPYAYFKKLPEDIKYFHTNDFLQHIRGVVYN